MEKNVYSKLVFTIILLASVFSFSACSSDDDEKQQLEEAEQLRYNEFVSLEVENTLKNTLKANLYRGINPPNVEGFFFFETHCVTSTIVGDPTVGTRRNDLKIKMHNQKGLCINFLGYEVEKENGIKYADHVAEGTFITGEGDYFSIFFNEETSYVGNDYITTAMTVLTGQVDRDKNNTIVGIKELQYVLMMIDNDGKPQMMPNGSGRLFKYDYADAITKEEFETSANAQSFAADTPRPIAIASIE